MTAAAPGPAPRPAPGPAPRPAPPLARRMAAFCYEALLLFGISLIPAVVGTVFFAQTGQRHPWQGETTVRLFALAVYAIYFVYFWSARGQTLAMQTWGIRITTAGGSRLSQGRALARYLVCSLVWLGLPALAAEAAGLSPGHGLALVAAWIAAYALLALAEPSHQFWHDRLCGTRLVDAPTPGAAGG